MNKGMNRRDFMKYSIATGVLIAAGERLQGLVSAEEAAKITEVDKLTIWVLADNYYDANEPDTKITKRYRSVAGEVNSRATRSFLLYRDCYRRKNKRLYVRFRT